MLNDADRALFTRLFGPELPEEMLEHAEPAKGVDCAPGDGIAEAAVSVLLSAVVHQGVGGTVLGWRAFERDGRAVLEVYRFRGSLAKAA
jgi:hypothetical protein